MTIKNPFDFVNSINYSKENLLEDEETRKENLKKYDSWLINHSFSYHPDTVALANIVNINHHISKEMQYAFLLNAVRKKKRFSKWNKTPKKSEIIKLIAERYNYNYRIAESVVDLFTPQQIEEIKKDMFTGGSGK